MSLGNNVSIEFTDAEKTELKKCVNRIGEIIKDRTVSLKPKERQQYGRVRYEKEVWISKVNDYMNREPVRIPAIVSLEESNKDFKAHVFLSEITAMMQKELELMDDTNLLIGYDLDFNSLIYYRRLQSDAKSNDQGAKTIYEDLKQQFPGGKRKIKEG